MVDSQDPNAARPARPFIPPFRGPSNREGNRAPLNPRPAGERVSGAPARPSRPFVARASGAVRSPLAERRTPTDAGPLAIAPMERAGESAEPLREVDPFATGVSQSEDAEALAARALPDAAAAPDVSTPSTPEWLDETPESATPEGVDRVAEAVAELEVEKPSDVALEAVSSSAEGEAAGWRDAEMGADAVRQAVGGVDQGKGAERANDATRSARSADAVAFTLELLAQRIRAGQLTVPLVDGELSEQAALVAALAALTGLRL